ncbi:MAG: hypothetical protein HUK26_03725, partial [Duodenibacillus sp.]|nr:hypothetical protein [Duodenibacillus sp.]
APDEVILRDFLAEAAKFYERAAGHGSAEACWRLARLKAAPLVPGRRASPKRAGELVEEAAAKGCAAAARALKLGRKRG